MSKSASNWQSTKYSAAAKRESEEEFKAKLRREEQARIRRTTACVCKEPVPDIGTYLGQKQCRLCLKLIGG